MTFNLPNTSNIKRQIFDEQEKKEEEGDTIQLLTWNKNKILNFQCSRQTPEMSRGIDNVCVNGRYTWKETRYTRGAVFI